jgi:hypothetical protein
MKKLRADAIQGVDLTIRSSIFCCLIIKRLKYKEIKFFLSFLSVRNLVSHIKRTRQGEVRKWGAKDDIWVQEGRNKREVEENT